MSWIENRFEDGASAEKLVPGPRSSYVFQRVVDIVVKDRHWHLWAFTDTLELLWDVALRTGHYPSNYQATVSLPGWAQSR